jgi:hypothetical protein
MQYNTPHEAEVGLEYMWESIRERVYILEMPLDWVHWGYIRPACFKNPSGLLPLSAPLYVLFYPLKVCVGLL